MSASTTPAPAGTRAGALAGARASGTREDAAPRASAGWPTAPLKFVVTLLKAKAEGADLRRAYVGLEHVESKTGRLLGVVEDAVTDGETVRFESGDVLYGKLRPYLAKAVLATFPGRCSPELLVLRPRLVRPAFLGYYLLSSGFTEAVDATTYGAKMPRASWDVVGRFEVPVPPTEVQDRMVSALDAEMERVDALLADKRTLVRGLQDGLQAAIDAAVSGAPATAATRVDSGVPWIGDLPDGWRVLPVRRMLQRLEQGWSPVAEDRPTAPGEWGVLKLSAIRATGFRPDEHKTLPPDLPPEPGLFIRRGDLLLTRANTPTLVGTACVVEEEPPSNVMICDLIYRLTFDQTRLDHGYAKFWLSSRFGRLQIERDARGSSESMVKIAQGHIRSWLIAFPPREEQRAIAASLARRTRAVASAVADLMEQIDALMEYRTAVISATIARQA